MADSGNLSRLEFLKQENLQLRQQILQIKENLGFKQKEEVAQNFRICKVFQMYDLNNSGFIEQKEFQALAAHLGLFLTVDMCAEAVKSISLSEAGQISLPEFSRWLTQHEQQPLSSATSGPVPLQHELGILKFNLQSQALVRTASYYKHQFTMKKNSDVQMLSQIGERMSHLKYAVETAGFIPENVRSSIRFSIFNDLSRNECNLPSPDMSNGVWCFVDFLCAPTSTDEELGELYGMLDTILNPLADMIPIPGCEFKIDMMEPSDATPTRRLRVGLFSPLSFVEQATQMIGANPMNFVGKFDVSIECAVALADILKPDFRLVHALRARVSIDGSIDQGALDVAKAILADNPISVFLPLISLWSDMSVVLKLFDPSTEVTGEGSLVSMPIINDSLPIPSHAAVLYTQLMQFVPDSISPILALARRNISGVARVQLQEHAHGISLQLMGLDELAVLNILAAQT